MNSSPRSFWAARWIRCIVMGGLFKFGEKGLPINGAPDLLQVLIQEIKPFILVGSVLQQVFQQQIFIGGGGDFRTEERIIRSSMRKYIFLAAAVLLLTGLWQGDPGRVWQKASRICLECIGIG